MNTRTIYHPASRWRIAVAFAAAALVHLAAIALAERATTPPALEATRDDGVEVYFAAEVPEPAAPETSEELPPPLPPPTADEPFIEEHPTPAPVVKLTTVARPLVRPTTDHIRNTPGAASPKILAVTAPRPEYPYEARRQRLAGSGVAALTIDASSGTVTDVAMTRSTGSLVLDHAAISGFRRWHFKPGTVSKVQTPITFTLTGASC